MHSELDQELEKCKKYKKVPVGIAIELKDLGDRFFYGIGS